MDLIAIARLNRTRGNRGELAATALSATPGHATQVWVNGAALEVERLWIHRDRLIFKFRGIDTISAAEPLAGAEVCIPAHERPALPEGEYYQSDLIGWELVEHKTGKILGRVTGWQEYGGPPLLEVSNAEGAGILVPFAKSICVNIDPQSRRIEVDLPEGLDEL